MNWIEIEEKFPTAFRKLRAAGLMSSTTDPRKWVFSGNNLRELYDFFDKNEIYCSVLPGLQLGTAELVFQIFIMYHEDGYQFDTRKLAEKFMFEKAFETLENKLL